MMQNKYFKVFVSCLLPSTCFIFANYFLRSTYSSSLLEEEITNFQVVTVISEETASFRRFQRSARVNGLTLRALEQYGDSKDSAGRLLLKQELEPYKNDSQKIIMFVGGCDVLINARVEHILQIFKKFEARVIFAASKLPSPLKFVRRYPPGCDIQYLNSGLFIGYAPELYRMVTSSASRFISDQEYYTEIYLNGSIRQDLQIEVDSRVQLFQTLLFAEDDVDIKFNDQESYVFNIVYRSVPLVIYGDRDAKLFVDMLSNYVPKAWNPVDGCIACLEDTEDLAFKAEDYPTIVIGIFIDTEVVLLDEFLNKIAGLQYPKNCTHLFVNNAVKEHEDAVEHFLGNYSTEFSSVSLSDLSARSARTAAIQGCVKVNCDYYFSVDVIAHLDNPLTLKLLIAQNRSIVAPMLEGNDAYNFQEDKYGMYPPGADFIRNNRRGLWIVPYVRSCYLIQGHIVHDPNTRPYFVRGDFDLDEAFNLNMHQKDVDRFVSNRVHFGHLSGVLKSTQFSASVQPAEIGT